MDLDESMKNLIQAEYFTQSINRLEAQMNYLTNTVKDKDESTLPNIFLIIHDCSCHIDRNEKSWYLEDFDQDSISLHQFEIDQSHQYQPISTQTLDQDQETHQRSQVEVEDTQPTYEKIFIHKCVTINLIGKLMS